MADYGFVWNERLLIHLPSLERDWEEHTRAEQAELIERWELIRGRIPDLILHFEQVINTKQAELYEEDSFERSCVLNYEIAEFASRINDLQIWYRMNQDLESRRHS
ncbi:hypothetical protein [Paenibacillus soyae]|uniref:Uncharacterized protein n=1 Tax=Paenibacillus soyae TaxID=2969249 RepID=A0A9X2S7M4_9BACL|nr:hypothetical protein [Paenibacillus soyae]MCR2803255.1 hypothetical protein [Paenibacillus soyae]